MSLYRQLGFKVPKQNIRNRAFQELLIPYLKLSLLVYIQDTETIDQLEPKQCTNLLKQYGILTNNRYIISSDDAILQKLTRYFLPQLRMFTMSNIVKTIASTIGKSAYLFSTPELQKTPTYRLAKEQLEDMLQTYQTAAIELNGSKIDLTTLNIPLGNIYNNLINLIQEWNANPTLSKYYNIILATKCYLFGYFLTQVKNTKAFGMNDKQPLPNINPLDLLHHETMYLEILSSFLSDIDPTLEKKITIVTDTLLSIGSYVKPIIWNITDDKVLQYIPFFIDVNSTFNDISIQILLRATIALILLKKEIIGHDW